MVFRESGKSMVPEERGVELRTKSSPERTLTAFQLGQRRAGAWRRWRHRPAEKSTTRVGSA